MKYVYVKFEKGSLFDGLASITDFDGAKAYVLLHEHQQKMEQKDQEIAALREAVLALSAEMQEVLERQENEIFDKED